MSRASVSTVMLLLALLSLACSTAAMDCTTAKSGTTIDAATSAISSIEVSGCVMSNIRIYLKDSTSSGNPINLTVSNVTLTDKLELYGSGPVLMHITLININASNIWYSGHKALNGSSLTITGCLTDQIAVWSSTWLVAGQLNVSSNVLARSPSLAWSHRLDFDGLNFGPGTRVTVERNVMQTVSRASDCASYETASFTDMRFTDAAFSFTRNTYLPVTAKCASLSNRAPLWLAQGFAMSGDSSFVISENRFNAGDAMSCLGLGPSFSNARLRLVVDIELPASEWSHLPYTEWSPSFKNVVTTADSSVSIDFGSGLLVYRVLNQSLNTTSFRALAPGANYTIGTVALGGAVTSFILADQGQLRRPVIAAELNVNAVTLAPSGVFILQNVSMKLFTMSQSSVATAAAMSITNCSFNSNSDPRVRIDMESISFAAGSTLTVSNNTVYYLVASGTAPSDDTICTSCYPDFAMTLYGVSLADATLLVQNNRFASPSLLTMYACAARCSLMSGLQLDLTSTPVSVVVLTGNTFDAGLPYLSLLCSLQFNRTLAIIDINVTDGRSGVQFSSSGVLMPGSMLAFSVRDVLVLKSFSLQSWPSLTINQKGLTIAADAIWDFAAQSGVVDYFAAANGSANSIAFTNCVFTETSSLTVARMVTLGLPDTQSSPLQILGCTFQNASLVVIHSNVIGSGVRSSDCAAKPDYCLISIAASSFVGTRLVVVNNVFSQINATCRSRTSGIFAFGSYGDVVYDSTSSVHIAGASWSTASAFSTWWGQWHWRFHSRLNRTIVRIELDLAGTEYGTIFHFEPTYDAPATALPSSSFLTAVLGPGDARLHFSVLPSMLHIGYSNVAGQLPVVSIVGGKVLNRFALWGVSAASTAIDVRFTAFSNDVRVWNVTGNIAFYQCNFASVGTSVTRTTGTITFSQCVFPSAGTSVTISGCLVNQLTLTQLSFGVNSTLAVVENTFNGTVDLYYHVSIDSPANDGHLTIFIARNVFHPIRTACAVWALFARQIIVTLPTAAGNAVVLCVCNNTFVRMLNDGCDANTEAIYLRGAFTNNSVVAITGDFNASNRGYVLDLSFAASNMTLLIDVTTPRVALPDHCGGVSIATNGPLLLNSDTFVRFALCENAAVFRTPVPFSIGTSTAFAITVPPAPSALADARFGDVSIYTNADTFLVSTATSVSLGGTVRVAVISDMITTALITLSSLQVAPYGKVLVANCSTPGVRMDRVFLGAQSRLVVQNNVVNGSNPCDRLLISSSIADVGASFIIVNNTINKPWLAGACASACAYFTVITSSFYNATKLVFVDNRFAVMVTSPCRAMRGIAVTWSTSFSYGAALIILRNDLTVNDTQAAVFVELACGYKDVLLLIDMVMTKTMGGVYFDSDPSSTFAPGSYVHIEYMGLNFTARSLPWVWFDLVGSNTAVRDAYFDSLSIRNLSTTGTVDITRAYMAPGSALVLDGIAALSITLNNCTLWAGARLSVENSTFVVPFSGSNIGSRIIFQQIAAHDGSSIVIARNSVAQPMSNSCPNMLTPSLYITTSAFSNGTYLCVSQNAVTPVTSVCSSSVSSAVVVANTNVWSAKSVLLIDATNTLESGTPAASVTIDSPLFANSRAVCQAASCRMTTASGSVQPSGVAPTTCLPAPPPFGGIATAPTSDFRSPTVTQDFVTTAVKDVLATVNNSTQQCALELASLAARPRSSTATVTLTKTAPRRRVVTRTVALPPPANVNASRRSPTRTDLVKVSRTVAVAAKTMSPEQSVGGNGTNATTSAPGASPPPISTVNQPSTSTPPKGLNVTTAPDRSSSLESLGLNAATAKAVAATAQSALGFAGAVSPSVANKGAATSRLVDASQCRGSDSAVQVPNEWQLLPPLPGFANKDNNNNVVAGMIASTLLLISLNLAALTLWAFAAGGDDGDASTVASLLVAAHGILLSYVGPNLLAASVLLLQQPGLSSAQLALGAVGVVLTGVMLGFTAWACLEHPPCAAAGEFHANISRTLKGFYEEARDLSKWYVRLHVLEDVSAALTMALLASLQQSSSDHCKGLTIALTLIAVLHLLYVVLIHPQSSRMDAFFAIANAGIMCSVALLSDIVLLSEQNERANVALGVALLASDAFYFGQAGIVLVLSLVIRCRTKNVNIKPTNNNLDAPAAAASSLHEGAAVMRKPANEQPDDHLDVPLLVLPSAGAAAPADVAGRDSVLVASSSTGAERMKEVVSVAVLTFIPARHNPLQERH